MTLPVLTNLGMHGQITHINAHQFAFSIEEIKKLFAAIFSVELSQEQAETILEETKGWVPALLLHGVGGNNTMTKVKRHPSREDIYDYLAEEVYQSQPDKTREFLSNTTILDELAPEFCDTFLDIRNSASILEELYLKNLFVTQLEGDKQIYRYHAVLKDFLLHQLQTKNPEHLLVLHYKAGMVFEKEQQLEEAIHHFIKARKPAMLAVLSCKSAKTTFVTVNGQRY